jgi:nucleoside-diphosphate-sugar epimerase
MRAAVTGAGGMVGGHLVRRLLDDGYEVTAFDIKAGGDWWQWHNHALNVDRCDVGGLGALDGFDEVYHLACDMGGIGFITANRFRCMQSTATNLAVLNACLVGGVGRVFYSSSACAYPTDRQGAGSEPLSEDLGWAGRPEVGYGEEKLYGEALVQAVDADHGIEGRIVRFHNVAGAPGTWTGGQEKAPAALCRKVAEAVKSGDHRITIWGDGSQARSYLDVADAVDGLMAVMASDCGEPLNVGSDRQVTVDELVSIIEGIAGVTMERTYDLSAPKGVAGRNADLTLVRERTGWEPRVPLEDMLERLYRWVAAQVDA